MSRVIPKEWMPKATLTRVHAHWTAGNWKSSPDDRTHYHFVIDGDGSLHRGVNVQGNSTTNRKGKWAYHTLNANTGAIGISVACMANAVESPFNPGRFPMTKVQWDKMILAIADLCEAYNIPVTPKTVLSHAEVQSNLGIKQRGKWDFTRLAFDPTIKGAKACGDKMRREVTAALQGTFKPQALVSDVDADIDVMDGGEPDEPTVTVGGQDTPVMPPSWLNTAQNMGDSIHWIAKMQASGYPNGDWQVFAVQSRLKLMKYNPGGTDGIWGGMTAGAIAAFLNDRPGTFTAPTSYEEFRLEYPAIVAELTKAENESFVRPVAPGREVADPKVVEKVAPETKDLNQGFFTKAWAAILGAVGLIFNWISDRIEKVWDFFTGSDGGTISYVISFFKSIPASFWVLVFIGLLVYLMMKDKLALNKITEDIKTGERQ
jgi:hypothetical protein